MGLRTSVIPLLLLVLEGCRIEARRRGEDDKLQRRIKQYRGPVYDRSQWYSGTADGNLYGLSSYKRRQLYRNDPYKEPTVCFNIMNLRDGTYGYFICPEAGQSDIYRHCCGRKGEQWCCTEKELEEHETMVRTLVGVVVGLTVIVFIIVITCIVGPCCRKAKAAITATLFKRETSKDASHPRRPPPTSEFAEYGLRENFPTKRRSPPKDLLQYDNFPPKHRSPTKDLPHYDASPPRRRSLTSEHEEYGLRENFPTKRRSPPKDLPQYDASPPRRRSSPRELAEHGLQHYFPPKRRSPPKDLPQYDASPPRRRSLTSKHDECGLRGAVPMSCSKSTDV